MKGRLEVWEAKASNWGSHVPIGALKFLCKNHVEAPIRTTDSGHYGQLPLALNGVCFGEIGWEMSDTSYEDRLWDFANSQRGCHSFLGVVWGVAMPSCDVYVLMGSLWHLQVLDRRKKSTILASGLVLHTDVSPTW